MSMMQLVGVKGREQGTFAHLEQLPRVPLPAFQDTLARFEEWCSPLLSAAELQQTQQAMQQFARPEGAGEKLHAALQAYDQQDGVFSWLDEFWPARYLGRRVPVSINANFVFLFKERPKTQLERAAELIAATVQYKQRLDDESLPVATLRGRPLCMSEYKYLFSTTRIPGKQRDTVNVPYSQENPGASTARHILVIHNGHLCTLEVINAEGKAYSLGDLERALAYLQDRSAQPAEIDESVGYFTTLARSDWADVRVQLLSHDPSNIATMQQIEQALFCVCLDESMPVDRLTATDEMLQGNGANRWFDKSVSFVVLKDGTAGINCEHCGLDGTVVVELVDAIHDETTLAQLAEEREQSQGIPNCEAMQFVLDDSLQGHLQRAQQDFQALVDNTATEHFIFREFGATHIKSLKMSPDAFLQLAFQLAHYRTKGLIGATYESIATRHFERGRTEAMRVVTPEVMQFVDAMRSDSATPAEKRAAFRAAADKHVTRAKECQAGQAPEQHLWQLLLIAEQQGEALGIDPADLALFESPGWLKMRDDYISTSSAPSDNVTLFGFGATSEQCIGVAYLPRADAIYAYLSTPTPVVEQMYNFSTNLSTVLSELASLLAEEENV